MSVLRAKPFHLDPAMVGVLVAFLAVDTATQLAFKAAAEAIGDLPLGPAFVIAAAGSLAAWLAVGFYVATYVLWMAVLQASALSRAFPLTAFSYVTVPLLAWVMFGERVELRTACGIALILAGLFLIGGESEAAPLDPDREFHPCGH